ncbi:Kef-type potassium/proton antiporter accessory protein, CPA2 family [Aquiflexum balticum DSM 16537]|uniref:Kef-type potassium/proton antiporter accessory protein, CPA2 family n=1 Tax=Aquiflexum balticum DSM 16537 TaxID=758820 RepID=A0A1W2H9B2_9BACT|nr:NAD(P)H-dependent oxidoreductase [Aquiflexum balticum]SMD45278.1 Kef-type potassium/proton antiporter accessory protein, CPA2 family [Aquiflexum balticum DSM 16537]
MKKVLVILAHPKYEHSIVNQALADAASKLENVEIRDLYELYPDFNIDVQTEQEILFTADIIIWQHPIYWYSAPPLFKQWLDLVLDFGWAYGPGGIYLKNKLVFNCVSSGGTESAYTKDGKHGHTLREFLLPFEQTAKLCHMFYLPPFHIGGTHKITSSELQKGAEKFSSILKYLRDTKEVPDHLFQLDELNHFKP